MLAGAAGIPGAFGSSMEAGAFDAAFDAGALAGALTAGTLDADGAGVTARDGVAAEADITNPSTSSPAPIPPEPSRPARSGLTRSPTFPATATNRKPSPATTSNKYSGPSTRVLITVSIPARSLCYRTGCQHVFFP